jgi:enoyl-[acyl-carrier protein] reductase I
VSAWVIPTDENLMIARHTRRLLDGKGPRRPSTSPRLNPGCSPAKSGSLPASSTISRSPSAAPRGLKRRRSKHGDNIPQREARSYAEPPPGALAAELFATPDVREAPQMTAVFAAIREKRGRLDFLVHSLAFAPKADLQGRLVNSSVEDFLTAMDISCHSFVRMAKRAEPLMTGGGVLLTMSYYGADKVIANYSQMGPVKAALEAAVRYLAYELGPKGIRVHAVSPGPLKTRAASGLAHFDELLGEAELRAPERDLVDILDIGAATAFLCSPFAKADHRRHYLCRWRLLHSGVRMDADV